MKQFLIIAVLAGLLAPNLYGQNPLLVQKDFSVQEPSHMKPVQLAQKQEVQVQKDVFQAPLQAPIQKNAFQSPVQKSVFQSPVQKAVIQKAVFRRTTFRERRQARLEARAEARAARALALGSCSALGC